MAMPTGQSVYPHILEDKDGVAWIEGTTTRVMEVVEEKTPAESAPRNCTSGILIFLWLKFTRRWPTTGTTRTRWIVRYGNPRRSWLSG